VRILLTALALALLMPASAMAGCNLTTCSRELYSTLDASDAEECSLRWSCAATLRHLQHLMERGEDGEAKAAALLMEDEDLALCLYRLQVLNRFNDKYCNLITPERERTAPRGWVD